jgi:hypothetical protein
VARVASTGTHYVVDMLTAPTGLPFTIAAISERENTELVLIDSEHVRPENVPADLAERSAGVRYPAFYVYCEKITNQLREKFRTFSGKARVVVDVRVSQDRLESLAGLLELYVEAVADVLDAHRGVWDHGMFYGGGYEITFGATRHGGKNFVQAAKIAFDVDISIN